MKKIVIYIDKNSERLGNLLKNYVKKLGYNVKTISQGEDFTEYLNKIVEASRKVVKGDYDRVIFVDEIGAKSFMISSKVKGMVTACISDEYSAKMTRQHNGALGLAIGSKLMGDVLAKNIVKIFLEEGFSAGRHMARIDMLNKMA